MHIEQSNGINAVVNVTTWGGETDSFEPYPEGARAKILVYSPETPLYDFITPNYPYLFKLSRERCPEQFWIEIFAYQLGRCMQIPVPPTFIGYSEQTNQYAALIEWFYSPTAEDIYIRGGDYFTRLIPNFDRERGEQHNFETITHIFQESLFTNYINWQSDWAKILLFDALIGNTDRHQDNWGIIITHKHKNTTSPGIVTGVRLSPAFDNGTSMGYELPEAKFNLYVDKRLEKYVNNGTHQLRWKLTDPKKAQHAELLLKFIHNYPDTLKIMLECLHKVNLVTFEKILEQLVKVDIRVKLTEQRALFMLKLIDYRHQRLLKTLQGL